MHTELKDLNQIKNKTIDNYITSSNNSLLIAFKDETFITFGAIEEYGDYIITQYDFNIYDWDKNDLIKLGILNNQDYNDLKKERDEKDKKRRYQSYLRLKEEFCEDVKIENLEPF